MFPAERAPAHQRGRSTQYSMSFKNSLFLLKRISEEIYICAVAHCGYYSCAVKCNKCCEHISFLLSFRFCLILADHIWNTGTIKSPTVTIPLQIRNAVICFFSFRLMCVIMRWTFRRLLFRLLLLRVRCRVLQSLPYHLLLSFSIVCYIIYSVVYQRTVNVITVIAVRHTAAIPQSNMWFPHFVDIIFFCQPNMYITVPMTVMPAAIIRPVTIELPPFLVCMILFILLLLQIRRPLQGLP